MSDVKINIYVGGERLDSGLLELLQRVEVREGDRQRSVARLRFGLLQGAGGEFSPLDDRVFEPAAEVGVDLEVDGSEPERLFQGYVSHLRPHFESIESNCYLEVIAMDASLLLDAAERVVSYPDMSDSEVAEEIGARYQIAVDARETDWRSESDRQLLVQRETDWRFLQRLAARNGYDCHITVPPAGGGEQLYFGPPELEARPQPDLAILRSDANLSWVDVQMRSDQPVDYRAASIDPLEKRIVSADAPSEREPMGAEGVDEWLSARFEDAGAEVPSARMRTPDSRQEALTVQTAAETDRARERIELRGELDPVAYGQCLRARRPVLVRGVGRLFAGTYYVQQVQTVLDQGELTQTFEAFRNAVDLKGSEEFGRDDSEVVSK